MDQYDEKYVNNELHYLVDSVNIAKRHVEQYSSDKLISDGDKHKLLDRLQVIISKWHSKIKAGSIIYRRLRTERMNIFTELVGNVNNTFLRAKLFQIDIAIRNLPKPPRAVKLDLSMPQIIRIDEIFNPYSLQNEAKWKTILKNESQSDFLLLGLASDSLSDNIYVANTSDISIIVLNAEGSYITGFCTITSPNYICIHKDYIYAYCLNGILMRADKTSGHVISRIELNLPNTPAGLTFDSEGNLYVCDNRSGNSIKVLDENFSFKKDIVLKEHNSNYYMIWRDDIRVFQENLYVLYSKASHPVKVYNLNGNFLRCVVYRDMSYLDKYFTIDQVGNIIVSVRGASCIKVYSNSGARLQTITDLNRLNGGIAVNNSFNLYISLSLNKHFNAILSLK